LVRKSLFITVLLITVSCSLVAQQGAPAFEFIENKGQWDPHITYKGELASGAFFLHRDGFTVVLHHPEDLAAYFSHTHHSGATGTNTRKKERKSHPAPGNPGNDKKLRSHAYRVRFLNAGNSDIVPDKAIPGYNNYFTGSDPSKWASQVKTFQAITYRNIYPNIDVRFYSENGTLKYDFIVHPGGNLGQVALQYEGADKLLIKNNQLIIKTSVGDVKELYPYSYQFDPAKGKREIPCYYELHNGNTIRFRTEQYDPRAVLIIDPSLDFSSFSRSTADNFGFTATYGPDGTLFGGGIAFSTGFPVTTGAYQTNFVGRNQNPGDFKCDVAIMKFGRNGTRIYATYLGHNDDEYPHSLVADGAGNLVIMGRTYSGNGFPRTVPAQGPIGGCDIFVTKLNADGTNLIGSMVIGGSQHDGVNIEDQLRSGFHDSVSLLRNYGDDSHSEVILDNQGNIYVAAQTQSNDFPITGTVFQTSLGGGQDGVVMKINPDCNTILWSTYLGGSDDDAAFVLALHPTTNDLYVAGGTKSTNFFPAPVTGVYQTTHQGYIDGYVAVLSNQADGAAFVTGTFLGTPSSDLIYGIQFDRNAFPYVMGVTRGTWPVVNAPAYLPNSKQFVSKLERDLSGFVYSTVFGSGSPRPNISPVAFLVDRCENIYVSGWGGWMSAGPDPYGLASTVGMPVTADAIKGTTDGMDFYFIVLERNAQSLLYGSFFGQDQGTGEHVDGGTSRFDKEGAIYMAICANCRGGNTTPFPTTPGVWGPVNGTGTAGCNMAVVKMSFNFAGVGSGLKAYVDTEEDSVGCVPFTVTFRDTVRNAQKYFWDFGDGTQQETTTLEVPHTYHAVGTYRVRLIAEDSSTCNIRDTSYITIRVRDDEATLDFTAVKQLPCESLSYKFTNTSIPGGGKPFTDTSFIWDFGDGTRIRAGMGSYTHSYSNPGPYTVRLILVDTNYCNAPDSMEMNLSVAESVKAQFETPPNGCVPYTAVFDNTSLGGQEFRWDFGDGTTSTEMSPEHLYDAVGTYQVKLVVVDSNTCNIADSTIASVSVHPVPTAAFTSAPVPALQNTPATFFNLSTGGVQYKWLFGDGDSTIRNTMDTVMHQYNATGTYEACLITYNEFGCTDTACNPVQALIVPLLDVPNAFTPGRGGQNSVIRVEGFGIGRMSWKIYNRWGQVVFETNNRKMGWDGTYKGQPQPMDVYAYTLDVEFTDGTKVRKTGDITLIR